MSGVVSGSDGGGGGLKVMVFVMSLEWSSFALIKAFLPFCRP